MKSKVLFFSLVVSFLFVVSSVYATLTVSVSLPTKSLTENEQVTVTVTVSNSAGSSTESNIITSLSSSSSWFSVVTSCTTLNTLSGGASSTSVCIIKPTSTGSDLTLTATSDSQGGTSGSGSTSGINVASQSSSLTASISGASSVDTSATFYVGVTVTAPSANDVVNARATISESGQCTVDTSYVSSQQSLGNITKGTSKSPTNWKLTSSSASGTCSITVNVVSDSGGSASPSKSITVGTSTGTTSTTGTPSGTVGDGAGTASKAKVTIGEKNATITIPSMQAKSENNISINSTTLAITNLKINVVNTVTNVQINVIKLDARPSNVVSNVPGIVSQYLNIERNANISAADIANVTFDFKVEKVWVSSNNIDENTVSLYRYENDVWNKLKTVKVKEENTAIYYQGISPGLSVFAIAGEAKAGTTPTAPTPPGPTPPSTTPLGPPTQPIKIPKPNEISPLIVIFVVLVVAIAGAVFIFVKKNAKKKRK